MATKKKSEPGGWGTRDEINHLSKLGLHTDVGKRLPAREFQARKRILLNGAQIGYGKRVDWGSLDREAILDHLKVLLIQTGG